MESIIATVSVGLRSTWDVYTLEYLYSGLAMIIVLAAIVLGKWELKRLVMFLAIVALCFGACNAFHKVSQSMAPPEYTVHDVPVDVPLSEL